MCKVGGTLYTQFKNYAKLHKFHAPSCSLIYLNPVHYKLQLIILITVLFRAVLVFVQIKCIALWY